MARSFFSCVAKSIALTAATVKSTIGVLAAANVCLNINNFVASFDGATSSNAPVVVEVCSSTFASNSPGTNSTAVTLAKADLGRTETLQASGGSTWTTEPTVLVPYKTIDIGQFNGAWDWIVPFSTPVVFAGAKGGVIRLTSPNNVNASCDILGEEG